MDINFKNICFYLLVNFIGQIHTMQQEPCYTKFSITTKDGRTGTLKLKKRPIPINPEDLKISAEGTYLILSTLTFDGTHEAVTHNYHMIAFLGLNSQKKVFTSLRVIVPNGLNKLLQIVTEQSMVSGVKVYKGSINKEPALLLIHEDSEDLVELG